MGTEKTLGDAIVERLSTVKLDARAKAAARAFVVKHRAYALAYEASTSKEDARSAALDAVGAADEALDARIDALADRLIGSGVSRRGVPFEGLSAYSPSDLCGLGYASEVREALKLSKAVRRKKPAKDILSACGGIETAAATAAASLKAYDIKHKEWVKAAAVRDAQLLDWQKSLTRLRILAKASLIDQPGAYSSLFARPEGMTIAKRPRKKAPKKARTVVAKPSSPAAPPGE